MHLLRQRTRPSKAHLHLYSLLVGTSCLALVVAGTSGSAGENSTTHRGMVPLELSNTFSPQPAHDSIAGQPDSRIAKSDPAAVVVAARPKMQDQDTANPSTVNLSDTSVDADDVSVNMSNVLRVRIRTNSAPELAGEYIINNGTLSMPMIGRLNIRDKRLSAVEDLITSKLSRALRRDVAVSVEIEQYKPFYIIGGVASAGEQEWHQGMTVIQAIASSGGIVNQAATVRAAGGDGVSATVKLRFALAQVERLKAERDHTADWQPSQRLISMERAANSSPGWSTADFIARQRKMLERQLADTRSTIENLESERDAAALEVKANEKQIQVVAEQLAIATQLSDVGSKLRDKQLVANSQFLHQRIELLRANVTTIEARGGIAKAQARIASLDRQIKRVSQERELLVAEKIESLEREIAEFETLTGKVGSEPTASRSFRYAISRKTDNATSTSPADLFTEVIPGDVIIVSQSTEETEVRSDAEAPAAGSDLAAAVKLRTQRYLDQAMSSPIDQGGRGQKVAPKAGKTATH